MGRKNTLSRTRTFTKKDHETWYRPKVEIEQVSIENDASSIYIGDSIVFRVRCRALSNATNIRARLVIQNENLQIIGMCISSNTISFEENSQKEFVFLFNTGVLAASVYSTRFSLFEINEYGNHDYICVTNDFFMFELQDRPEEHAGMVWSVASWGNIVFDSFLLRD